MRFSIMDQTGHTAESFDTTDKVSLEAAMARFGELTKGPQRMTAAARYEAGTDPRVIRKFDGRATEIVFVPPLMGG